jgi:hypothetical protein
MGHIIEKCQLCIGFNVFGRYPDKKLRFALKVTPNEL